jgi:hypothetical protein
VVWGSKSLFRDRSQSISHRRPRLLQLGSDFGRLAVVVDALLDLAIHEHVKDGLLFMFQLCHPVTGSLDEVVLMGFLLLPDVPQALTEQQFAGQVLSKGDMGRLTFAVWKRAANTSLAPEYFN